MGRTGAEDQFGEIGYACAWAIPVPVLVLEADTIVFANAALVRLLGYESAWDLIGANVDTIVHDDAREAAASRRALTAMGERLDRVPTKLVTRSGDGIATCVSAGMVEVEDAELTIAQFAGLKRYWPAQCWPEPPALGSIAHPMGLAILEVLDVPIIVHTSSALLYANAIARQQLGATTMEDIAERPMLSVVHPDSIVSSIERGIFFYATRQPIIDVPVKLRGLNGAVMRAVSDAYPVKVAGKWVALVVGSELANEAAS